MDLEELQQKIRHWASKLDFRVRIYFCGSRLKGTSTIESDLDLASEFLEECEKGDVLSECTYEV